MGSSLPTSIQSTTSSPWTHLILTIFHPLQATAPTIPSPYSKPLTSAILEAHITQQLHELPPASLSTFPPHQLRHIAPLSTYESTHNLQLTIQPLRLSGTPSPQLRPRCPRIALFDLDSTLILNETIDELAAATSQTAAVAAITARAMAGELDFRASLEARVARLEGARVEALWEGVWARVRWAPGARELVRALKALGCWVGVVSGGFEEMVDWVVEEVGADAGWGNKVSGFGFGFGFGR